MRRYVDHPTRQRREGGLSPFTVSSRVRAFKRLFNWLEEEGILEGNPARRIKIPRPVREKPKGISRQDLLALIREKGNKTRFVPFMPATAEALAAWLEVRPQDQGPWVFVGFGNHSEGALTANSVGQILHRRAALVGVTGPVNPHAFRHAFARDFLLDGGDLGTLSDLMGHSDVSVTKAFYGIFKIEELQEKHRRHSPIAKLFGGGANESSEYN